MRASFWGTMAATAVLMSAVPALAAEERVRLDLPAQGLSASLDALAAQAHVQMLYAGDAVRGLKAPELRGEFAVSDALRRLLSGSGLEARADGATFVIVKGLPVTQLDAVTVTATRTENKAFDVPASVTVVRREQFDDAQAKDMATVMRDVPGVTWGGTPREAGQLPSVRGYQGPNIIMQVDGARRALDSTVGTYSPMLLDPNFVKQVDVVRGPSSSAYGSGGLGGVVAVETLDAEDVLQSGETAGGWLKTSYRSGDVSLSGNLVTAAQAEGASVVGGATVRNYHSIDNGAGGQSLQDGTAKNGLLKLSYAPNDLHRFKVGYSRFFDNGLTPTNPSGNDQTTTGYQHLERSQDEFTGSWAFRDDARKWFDGKVSAYHTDLKYDAQKRFGSALFGTNMTVNQTTTGASAQNTNRFATGTLEHRLTYGADGYKDELTNTSVGAGNGVQPDGDQSVLGGFVQDEIKLSTDWTLIAALRHDSYEAEAASQPGNSDEHLSPKLAVKWQALPMMGIYTSYGEAFRAPTLSELYNAEYRTTAFNQFRPNPTLKPAVAHTWEVGATLTLNDLADKGDALRAKATVFDEEVDDMITSKTIGTYAGGFRNITQYQNVDTAHRWGGELESDYRLGDWHFNAGYSRIRVKDKKTGENLFAPPDKITAGVGYYVNDYWSLRYAGRYVMPQDYDSSILRRRDSHHVHDIGTSYDRDWYRLDFSVTNLFDYAYASYQQGLNTNYTYEEGRSFNLTFTARF